jgi:hypothetical protein
MIGDKHMKKRLIACNNLDEFVQPGDTVFRSGPDTILTPGARDALRNRGVRIEYVKEATSCPSPVPPAGPEQAAVITDHQSLTRMAEQIVRLLHLDYGVSDQESLERFTLAILSRLDQERCRS